MQATRSPAQPAPAGINPADILYVLFRHKWKIILLGLLGLGAAAAYDFLTPPVYQSQAKLLVRYVVERSAVDTVDSQVGTTGPRGAGEGIIKSEIDILTSWDLAMKVAEIVGPDKILQGSDHPTATGAAKAILAGLTATAQKGSNVIVVSFTGRNPEVTQRVLNELVGVYQEKHLEVHRSMGAFDFVSQQTDQVRSRLRQTEEELQKLKREAGIVSLPGSIAALDSRLASTQQELLSAEAAVAAHEARVAQLEGALGEKAALAKVASGAPAAIDSGTVSRYQAIVARLAQSRQQYFAYLAKFTPESQAVKTSSAEIADLEEQRKKLEADFPALISTAQIAGGEGAVRLDPFAEKAALAAARARVEALTTQLATVQKQAVDLSNYSQKIEELERKRTSEAEYYKYFESSLEKARIDEALDPSKIPNINKVQEPSPAFRVTGDKKKVLMGLAGSGFALGLGLAFLIEFLLDKSVRRPFELEKSFGIPQLVTIPKLKLDGRSRALANGSGKLRTSSAAERAPWDKAHSMRSYADAIRDRLIYSFQIEDVTHKPKMVGVTGCAEGVGATTLASSLAASLSETGDGKVLLVDVNTPKASAHPFFDGRPTRSLTDTLERNGADRLEGAPDNLYLATVGSSDPDAGGLIPKTLFKLMPKVKASDFDYIIFDMPPVAQTSPTATLAGFMDKILFVVESEKSNREVVKRAYDVLIAGHANVLGVINKARQTVPKWIESHG